MAKLGRPRIADGLPDTMSRQLRWQMRQRIKGQCINCTRPAVTDTKCERHRTSRVKDDGSYQNPRDMAIVGGDPSL